MHMDLEATVAKEAERRVLLPQEATLQAAQAVAQRGYTRREFLTNAMNLGKLALVGGAGVALQAYGSGAGLDGRISLDGVDAEFQEFVDAVTEYAVYRATRKLSRKPGELGDILRPYQNPKLLLAA